MHAVLAAVRRVNDASTTESFPSHTLEAIGEIVSSDTRSFNEVDPVTKRVVALTDPLHIASDPAHSRAELVETLGRLSDQHPIIHYISATSDGSARAISDFWSMEEFHSSRIYAEVYRWVDVEHQMSITLPAVLPRIVAIAVNRSDPRNMFTERDRAVLNLVRPHLAQAYQQIREGEHIRRLLDTAARFLQSDGVWIILLENDQPHDVTNGALIELYRFFGRPSGREPFPTRVSQWLDNQRHATMLGGLDDPNAVLRPLTTTEHGRRVTMRHIQTGPTEALIITLQETLATRDAQAFESLGLSERETLILHCVASGLTNQLIAQRLSISRGTVKKHLDNCYRKLGVRNRAQAVALAYDLLGHEKTRNR